MTHVSGCEIGVAPHLGYRQMTASVRTYVGRGMFLMKIM